MNQLAGSNFPLLLILFLSVVSVETVQGEKVFIWKDNRGVTHYSDRPGPSGMETDFILSDEDLENDQGLSTDELSGETPDEPPSDTAAEAPGENPVQPASAPAPSAPETIAFCNRLKANLKALDTSGRIRLTHEDGQEDILDDAGKKKEKQRLMALMDQFCK